MPRQLFGFAEYRAAMLNAIRGKPPLLPWRAREGDDLGVMTIEFAAYVYDVLGFYDERITNNFYLTTAERDEIVRRLVGTIGYQPRPAVAAEADIALSADVGPEIVVRAGSAFRSTGFGNEPPQVFEASTDTAVSFRHNGWNIGPAQREWNHSDGLLFSPRDLALTRNGVVLFEDNVGRVTAIDTVVMADGANLVRVTTTPDITTAKAEKWPSTHKGAPGTWPPTVKQARQRAMPSPFEEPVSGQELFLDRLYSDIAPLQTVVVESGGKLTPHSVTGVESVTQKIKIDATNSVPIPVTKVKLLPDPPAAPATIAAVHYDFVNGGRFARPAATRLSMGSPPVSFSLQPPAEVLATPAAGPFLLRDKTGVGARIDATVAVDADGHGTLTPPTGWRLQGVTLDAPIKVLGNVVHVTRGETVAREVLGSGDATRRYQSFRLAKKPLTYLAAANATSGVRSTLEIRVGGLLWRELPSFFGTKPGDQVYIVRHNDDHEAIVTFDRLPSGVNNVVARYRYGAGAAKPPAGSIEQMASPIPGVRGVANPVPASGGSDGDDPRDLKGTAPRSTLTLGRAVSLADFEAMSRGYPGVVNVASDWGWDQREQRAVVMLWIICDQGDVSDALAAFLRSHADPTVPLSVRPAQRIARRLAVHFAVDPQHEREPVAQALTAKLTDAHSGLLSWARAPIGCTLFRSVLLEDIVTVPGIAEIEAVMIDGAPMPFALTSPSGAWYDFLPFDARG
ncbi:hypothetical protein QIH91_13405 [Bradyrhizobium japonicum USDA 135]|nr:hypothetical protein QIH91_13405 [Bradyrhizobium japonicum USDA 135]